MVQWLRLCAVIAGGKALILGQGIIKLRGKSPGPSKWCVKHVNTGLVDSRVRASSQKAPKHPKEWTHN